jgi:hypothetical protein
MGFLIISIYNAMQAASASNTSTTARGVNGGAWVWVRGVSKLA